MSAGVNLGSAVGYLDLDTSKFNNNLKGAMDNLNKAMDSSETAGNRFSALGAGMASIGAGLTKNISAPLALAGAGFLATAGNFQSAMSTVQATSGATAEEIGKLSDKAKDLGANTAHSASNVAEAFNYMAMAGWDTEQMLAGIEGVMNLASASGEDLAMVSDIVTDGLTALGMSAEDTTYFCDVLATTASASNTSVGMMGETFKYVAPVAGALGYNIEDVALASGLMANAGIKASQAGTTLRGAMTRMIKPTDDAYGVMEKLGLAADGTVTAMVNADGSMREFGETMDILRYSFNGLSEAQQAEYAATIFGQEAMSGMLAIINASDEDYLKLADSISESSGRAKEMAEIKMDNLKGDITMLGSAVEGLGIAFGEILMPFARQVVQIFSEIVTSVTEMSAAKQKLIIVIGALATVIPPLILIIGTLIKSFMSIQTSVTLITPVIKSLGAMIAGINAPIMLVIGAVAALVYAWNTNFMGIRDFTEYFCREIKSKFDSFISEVKTAWNEGFTSIKVIINAVFESIKIIVQTALKVVTDIFFAFLNLLMGNTDDFKYWMIRAFKEMWEGVKGIFGTAMSAIYEIGKTWVSNMTGISTDMIDGFVNGIKDGIGRAIEACAELGRSALNSAKSVLGIHSPSREFMAVGKYIDEGLALGIKNNSGVTTDAMMYLGKHILASGNSISTGLIQQEEKTGKFIYDTRYKTVLDSVKLYEQDRNNRVKSMQKGTDESLKAIQKEIDATQKASDMKMKIYEQELQAKLRLIDTGLSEELAGLQGQLDAMDAQEEQESRDEKTNKYKEELEALKEKLQLAEDNVEFDKIKKEMDELNANRQKELLAQQRADERKAIREQMEEARERAKQEQERLKEEYEALQYNLQMQREAELEHLKTVQALLQEDLELRKELQKVQSQIVENEEKLRTQKLSKEQKKQTQNELSELRTKEKNIVNSMDLNMKNLKGYTPQIDDIAKKYGDSLEAGIMSTKDSLFSYLDQLYSKAMSVISAMQEASSSVGESRGSYASGLDYVPRNGFKATLHEGERIMTAEENKEYSSGRNKGGGDTFIFQSPKALTPKESARQMKRAKRDLALGFN